MYSKSLTSEQPTHIVQTAVLISGPCGDEHVRCRQGSFLHTNTTLVSTSDSICLHLYSTTLVCILAQGQYDRVHVGASCPPDRVAALLPLLRPEGGRIVTPVSPNDLRLITVNAEGKIEQSVISQVRYGELEVCMLCLRHGSYEHADDLCFVSLRAWIASRAMQG